MKIKTLFLSALSMSTFLSPAFAAIDDDGDGGGGIDTGDGSDPTGATISRSFNYEPSWGSTDWGASLYAGGGVSVTAAATLAQRDQASGSGTLAAYARINGTRQRLLGVRAYAKVENGRSAEFTAAASVGSSDFWTYAQRTTLANNVVALIQPSWDKTLFDQRVGVWVGPVPVTFRAQVTGRIGAGLTTSLNVTRFGVTFTPTAGASLYASAAIGGEYCIAGLCAGASAGVYTDLNLFTVSVPTRIEAGLTPLPNGLSVSLALRSDVSVRSLDGELGVFAEAHLGDLDYSWSTDLVTWSGYSSGASLIAYGGTSCLVGSCITTLPGTPRGK